MGIIIGDISITQLIIGTIILYIFYHFVTYGIVAQTPDPPRPVGIAGLMEAVWGMLVFGSGALIDNPKDRFWGLSLMLLGFFWVCVAISLYKASKIGRMICLILSILRIPTVVGILFSILSLRLLFFNRQSKDFFENKRTDDNPAIAETDKQD